MASSSAPGFSQPQAQPQGRGMGPGRGQGRGRGRGRGRGQFSSQAQGSQHPQHEQTRGIYGGHRRAPRAVSWPTAPKILVVDLEATCWDTKEPPPGQKSEIIEIGWALVDLAGTDTPVAAGSANNKANAPSIIRTGTILVKPVRSEVSAFCTELTTITAELLDAEGIPLRQAFKQLTEDLESHTIPWCSWGDYDRNMINRTCDAMKIASPFNSTHYNVKDLCKELYPNLNGGYGMKNALIRVAREPLEGTLS